MNIAAQAARRERAARKAEHENLVARPKPEAEKLVGAPDVAIESDAEGAARQAVEPRAGADTSAVVDDVSKPSKISPEAAFLRLLRRAVAEVLS